MTRITKNWLIRNDAPKEVIKIFLENFSENAKIFDLLTTFVHKGGDINSANWLMLFLSYCNTSICPSNHQESYSVVSLGNIYRRSYVNVYSSVCIKGDYTAKWKITVFSEAYIKAKNVYSDEIIVKDKSFIWVDNLVKTKILKLEGSGYIQGKINAEEIYINGKLFKKG